MLYSEDINILLVEDDEIDIKNVQRAFKKNKIVNPLHIARNGLEAFAKLRGTEGHEKITPRPSIILLDINMPKMNGIEFLTELRADAELSNIAVFVMTTSGQDHDISRAYALNVAGYIIKPVSFESFVKSVSTLNTYWNLIELPVAG